MIKIIFKASSFKIWNLILCVTNLKLKLFKVIPLSIKNKENLYRQTFLVFSHLKKPNVNLTRDCWEDFHEPGCSDPMDDPEGKFENMVQCFCSSDRCNGATQSDGGTTPKNSDQTRTTQTTSVGLTETTNNGSRLTQPNGDQAQTTQTTSVGLTGTTNNGSTETSGSPAQTTTSSATAKNHNSLQAVIVSEFVLFLCFNGHFINS